MKPKTHHGTLKAKNFRFAIIESRWNDFLVSKLTEGAVNALERLGVKEENVEIFKVPGSFELPLTAQRVAESGKFDAIVCVGVVIRGETPHFNYIAGEVSKGISHVSIKVGLPILFGVITADTVEQAINRSGIKSGNKGFEAAMSAVEIINLYNEIDGGLDEEKAFPHVV